MNRNNLLKADAAINLIPGFYENPLYKIYPDHSEKRKRIKQP